MFKLIGKLIKYIIFLVIGLIIISFMIGVFNPSEEDGSSRSFTCSYGNERSKIKITGSTAKEITAAGIVITYSNVSKSDKGAYSLEGSSKKGRAWFIGAISYLLLDTNMIPYKCK